MPNMTDRAASPGSNLVNRLLQMIFCLTATTTYTPGTGGGSAFTVTLPFLLKLMTANASPINSATNGTEASGNGYTTGGSTLGSPAFGTPSAGVISNSNSVSWTASGGNLGGAAIVGIEIQDSAATKLRYLQGSITSVTVASGNTLQFAAASITADASQW